MRNAINRLGLGRAGWGLTRRVLGPDGHGEFFTGTTACLSALYGAQRYNELVRLVDSAHFNWRHYRRWGVDALMAQGLPAEALRYALGPGIQCPIWRSRESR